MPDDPKKPAKVTKKNDKPKPKAKKEQVKKIPTSSETTTTYSDGSKDKTTTTYDKKTGKKTQDKTEHYDKTGKHTHNTFENYDAEGRLVRKFDVYITPLPDGTENVEVRDIYDEKGRLIRRITSVSKGTHGTRTTQDYDPETGKPKGAPHTSGWADIPM